MAARCRAVELVALQQHANDGNRLNRIWYFCRQAMVTATQKKHLQPAAQRAPELPVIADPGEKTHAIFHYASPSGSKNLFNILVSTAP